MDAQKTKLKKDIKFGLYCYDTKNIGDEIQSIAAERFLPRIDYYINRDNISSSIHDKTDNIKLIANGWYLEPSINDNKSHWPPNSINLSPLFISMHINPKKSYELFKKTSSINYLKKFAPIGARDISTQKFLQSLNIPSYFSGCMTLTLLPSPHVTKSDYILAVGVSDKIIESIKKRTKRPVIQIDTLHAGILSTQERFALARYYLTLYQSAHCVVTTRLHTMLPSLALNTPVIAITINDTDRFGGLIELVNSYSESAFIKSDINLDHPPSNPRTYISIRDNLVKRCKEYTGYDSKLSYLKNLKPDELYHSPSLITATTKTFLQGFNDQETIVNDKHEIKGLQSVIHELRNLTNDQESTIKSQNQTIEVLNNKLLNPGVKTASKIFLRSILRKFK